MKKIPLLFVFGLLLHFNGFAQKEDPYTMDDPIDTSGQPLAPADDPDDPVDPNELVDFEQAAMGDVQALSAEVVLTEEQKTYLLEMMIKKRDSYAVPNLTTDQVSELETKYSNGVLNTLQETQKTRLLSNSQLTFRMSH